jgi:hypothetical protein
LILSKVGESLLEVGGSDLTLHKSLRKDQRMFHDPSKKNKELNELTLGHFNLFGNLKLTKMYKLEFQSIKMFPDVFQETPEARSRPRSTCPSGSPSTSPWCRTFRSRPYQSRFAKKFVLRVILDWVRSFLAQTQNVFLINQF